MVCTLATLNAMKSRQEKIVCMTSYDASFTQLIEDAGVEVTLVGDSLGMVCQGHKSTLPVTLDEMLYHTQCVTRVATRSLVIADLPFLSYCSPDQAMESAGLLMKEGGAHMIKLEGGASQLANVRLLTGHSIPVCAHLGLTPQSVHQLGGYRVQGRDEDVARKILDDARELEAAGAALVVLECIPSYLAKEISESLSIPTIGIGAGVDCDGQILVVYDALGITSGGGPKFSRNFLEDAASIPEALQCYVADVKAQKFPAAKHTFS